MSEIEQDPVQNKTTIFLADLAHTATVADASIPIPLGIGYVAAYLRAYFGDAIEIKLFKHPEKLLAAAKENPPTVLGLAHYGWNDNLNNAVGKHLRAVLPDTLFIGGGPNIDLDEKPALAHLNRHDYLDYYILEGGEEPFAELVDWWVNSDRETVDLPNNVIWADGGNLRRTGERPLTKIIDSIPSPYLGGFLDEFIDAGMMPLFETNRGCPFRCTFCAWGMASRNLVRRFSLDTALAEIEYVGTRSNARNWLICDANFGILKRDVEIAKAIRAVKDRSGLPEKCHAWLAKNVTDRNLEIAEILGDMVHPVMAVQSMDADVLREIKRDNISLETYQIYQQRFHEIGSKTYSDVIVPLPGETVQTHLDGLRQLFEFQVDIIQNHNCRMLAGCEMNSVETRERWGFRTRYRLIHGDAGSYDAGGGEIIKCFEYEESLRETTTVNEADLFFFRKFHFLVEFCWNSDVYKPILKYLADRHQLSPVDVLLELCGGIDGDTVDDLAEFWTSFDASSHDEWFDSAEDIEAFFADPGNFQRLTSGGFDKLNTLFSIVVLRDFKETFDTAFRKILDRENSGNDKVGSDCADLTFARFPSFREDAMERAYSVAPAALEYFDLDLSISGDTPTRLSLKADSNRATILATLNQSEGMTISKILNTQGIALSDLSLVMGDSHEEPAQTA